MNIIIFVLIIFSILFYSFAKGGHILKRNSGGGKIITGVVMVLNLIGQ